MEINYNESINDQYLYARGYVIFPFYILDYKSYVPKYFQEFKINNYYTLLYDYRNVFSFSQIGNKKIFSLGEIIDIENPAFNIKEILNLLLSSYIEGGILGSKFLKVNENLCGRYAIFIIEENNIKAFNDASGLKSIYYHTKYDIFSSHYELINHYANESISKIDINNISKEHENKKLPIPLLPPGDLTLYSNIRILISNYIIEIPERKLTRFFPIEKIKEYNIAEIVNYISEKLKLIINKLSEKYSLVSSITGGFDSRMTLSASKDVFDKIKFFTFYKSLPQERIGIPSSLYDGVNNIKIAKKIANYYKLNYYEICLDNFEFQLNENTIKNHYITDIPKLMPLLLQRRIIDKNSLYIRSNVYEVIRNSGLFVPLNLDKETLSKKLAEFSFFNIKSIYYKEICNYYNYFIDKYNIFQVLSTGYNYGDLFLSENRMTQWMSACLIETDPYIDTLSPINCRKLIKLGMSFPRELKERNKIAEMIIEHNCEELMNDFNYPNDIQPLGKKIDNNVYKIIGSVMLINRITGEYAFKINQQDPLEYHNDESYFFECTNESLICGFAKNIIKKDDKILISFNFPLKNESYYYLSFTITSIWHDYAKFNRIYYEILINKKSIYRINLNAYSKPNMFIYYFNSKEYEKLNLEILIISGAEHKDIYHNSILKMNNFVFRRDVKRDIPLPYFTCTQLDSF